MTNTPMTETIQLIGSTQGPEPEKIILSSPILTEEEQETLKSLVTRWENRAPCFRKTSQQYQILQERFLPLLALAAEDRQDEFENMRNSAGWTAATTSSYWTAVIAAAKVVGVEVNYTMKKTATIYAFMAKEENPARPTIPASEEEIRQACQHLCSNKHDRLAVALELSFILGQRIGDTLRLQKQKIGLRTDAHSQTTFVTIQFVEGKTTRRRDPFTLHIPTSEGLANKLHALAQTPGNNKYLFGEDTIMNAMHIRTAMMTTRVGLTLLSIRRGGLVRMAQKGATLHTLLHHSRHASEQMLMRYLGWGEHFFTAARELTASGFFNNGPSTSREMSRLSGNNSS